MREISLSERQEILSNILFFFHNYCEEKHLRYYLIGGTLIGAVRHNGFIPWDDDIDVVMPRKDYEIFLSEYKETQYELFCYRNNKKYYLPFAKLSCRSVFLIEDINHGIDVGVHIDIFPMDNLPNKIEAARKFNSDVKRFRWLLHVKFMKFDKNFSIKKKIKYALVQVIPLRPIILIVDKMSQRYNKFGKSNYQAVMCMMTYGEKEIFRSDWFDGKLSLHFEGNQYNVPSGYDELLRQVYGDYMKLPPVEKRVTNHNVIVKWK